MSVTIHGQVGTSQILTGKCCCSQAPMHQSFAYFASPGLGSKRLSHLDQQHFRNEPAEVPATFSDMQDFKVTVLIGIAQLSCFGPPGFFLMCDLLSLAHEAQL